MCYVGYYIGVKKPNDPNHWSIHFRPGTSLRRNPQLKSISLVWLVVTHYPSLEDGIPGLGSEMIRSPPLNKSHNMAIWKGNVALLRGITHHGYYPLTGWEDPPSTPPNVNMPAAKKMLGRQDFPFGLGPIFRGYVKLQECKLARPEGLRIVEYRIWSVFLISIVWIYSSLVRSTICFLVIIFGETL